MRPVEYYPFLVKKKLSYLVDSTEQDHCSRRAYLCIKYNVTKLQCKIKVAPVTLINKKQLVKIMNCVYFKKTMY